MDVLYKKYGYTEMYEWADIPINKFGLFLQFSKDDPCKVTRYHTNGDMVLGVSTISSEVISDDPDEWKNAYLCDEVGDICLKKESLAVGTKVYDQHMEISYINTRPWEHYIKVPTADYDSSKTYRKRSVRREWVKVNLLGKCIVYDDGTCTPGKYCTPYIGSEKIKWGHAIPASSEDTNKYYVLERVSENTIMIVLK